MFPVLDSQVPVEGLFPATFRLYLMMSIVITSYGFGRGAMTIFLSTFRTLPD